MSLKRVVTVEDLSSEDYSVSGGLLRLKNGSYVFDSSTADFIPATPLVGWTQPTDPKEDSTATVVFRDGVAFYNFAGGTWSLSKYDSEYHVPTLIPALTEVVVPVNTQMLYAQTITVNGLLTIDGVLIQVDSSSPTPTCCTWAQIHWDFNDTLGTTTGKLVLFSSTLSIDDLITWQFYDVGVTDEWIDIQSGGIQYDWSNEHGAGIYRVKIEVAGCCDYITNVVETISV